MKKIIQRLLGLSQTTTSSLKWRPADWSDYEQIVDNYSSVIEDVFIDFGLESILPDKELYKTLYVQGTLFGIVGTDGDKVVAAYVWRKVPSKMDVTKYQANELVYYIDKEYQGKGYFKHLLRFAEDQARANGCVFMDMMLPSHNKRIANKMNKYGYKLSEVMYLKRL